MFHRRHRRCALACHDGRLPAQIRTVSAPGHTTGPAKGPAHRSVEGSRKIVPAGHRHRSPVRRRVLRPRPGADGAETVYGGDCLVFKVPGPLSSRGRPTIHQPAGSAAPLADRMMEVDDVLRQYQQGQNPQQTAVRQRARGRHLQELRRDLQERLTRSLSVSSRQQSPRVRVARARQCVFPIVAAGRRRAGVQGRHRRRSEIRRSAQQLGRRLSRDRALRGRGAIGRGRREGGIQGASAVEAGHQR